MLVKKKRLENKSIYIQREILTRLTNGIFTGTPKTGRFGNKKPSQIFPFQGEKDDLLDMMEAMKEDIAFQPGVVYVDGRGFIHKSELNANGNAT